MHNSNIERLKRFIPKRKLQFPSNRIENDEELSESYVSSVSLDISMDYTENESETESDTESNTENNIEEDDINIESSHPSDEAIMDDVPELKINTPIGQPIPELEAINNDDDAELPHIVDAQDKESTVFPPLPIKETQSEEQKISRTKT